MKEAEGRLYGRSEDVLSITERQYSKRILMHCISLMGSDTSRRAAVVIHHTTKSRARTPMLHSQPNRTLMLLKMPTITQLYN